MAGTILMLRLKYEQVYKFTVNQSGSILVWGFLFVLIEQSLYPHYITVNRPCQHALYQHVAMSQEGGLNFC